MSCPLGGPLPGSACVPGPALELASVQGASSTLDQSTRRPCPLPSALCPLSRSVSDVGLSVFSVLVGAHPECLSGAPLPGGGAALTNASGQSPTAPGLACTLGEFGGSSSRYPRNCDGDTPTSLEGVTGPRGGIRIRTRSLCRLLPLPPRRPIYLSYLYLFNFYLVVYPIAIAFAPSPPTSLWKVEEGRSGRAAGGHLAPASQPRVWTG